MEVKYRKVLLGISSALQKGTEEIIYPVLETTEPEYTADGYASDLIAAFDRLRLRFLRILPLSKTIAEAFVLGTSRANRERFYSAIESSLGISLRTVVLNEGIEDTLLAATQRNVGLIRSIPEEYFKQIEQIIFTETTQGSSSKSIIKQLREIGSKTDSRARLIARDQTSKLNGELNKGRQQNLGIEEYIWSTSGDERVRPTHRDNDGKTFRWDSPPPETGHPGQDIQCRCVARPIIKL